MSGRRRLRRLALLLLVPAIGVLFWGTAVVTSNLPATEAFAVNVHGLNWNGASGGGDQRPAPLSLSVLDDARLDASAANPGLSGTPPATLRPSPPPALSATPSSPTPRPTLGPAPSLIPVPTPTLPVSPTPSSGPATISGQVVDSQTRNPIAGATVSLSPGGASTITDVNGNFTFSVAPGSYTVTASAPLYASASQSATVKGGQRVSLFFKLTSVTAYGDLTGSVVDSTTQAAVAGATVSLSNGLVRVTDVNGNFSYTIVLAGSYTLTVSALGYIAQSQAVTIKAGHTSNVQIDLVHS